MIYSQNNIEQYFDSLFTVPSFFLEIGAWDGEHYSQTKWLEHTRGWTGLCVDPFLVNFENRDCLVCNKAISIDGLPREFIKVAIDRRNGGDVSYWSGFADSMYLHWDDIKRHCEYDVITVETITFEQLIVQYNLPPHIGFLSVDTEGSELEVFKGIDFSKNKFGLIMYEHNFEWVKRTSISNILIDNGYILYKELEFDDLWIENSMLNG